MFLFFPFLIGGSVSFIVTVLAGVSLSWLLFKVLVNATVSAAVA